MSREDVKDSEETVLRHLMHRHIAVHVSDDELWDEWVGLRERDERDLIKLLDQDVRPGFKARALGILLGYDPGSPFEWRRGRYGNAHALATWLEAGSLTPELLLFTIEVLLYNFEVFFSQPRMVSPAYEASKDDERNSATFARLHNAYNDIILRLLRRLPPEAVMSLKLFECYSLAHSTERCPTRYKGFYALLADPKVPEQWKVKADKAMREFIHRQLELQGPTRGYDEKSELAQYMCCLDPRIEDETYSVDLLGSQLEFVLGLPGIGAFPVFRSSPRLKLWERLADPGWEELRYGIAKHVTPSLSITNEQDCTLAALMRKDTLDPLLQGMLDEFLEDAEGARSRLENHHRGLADDEKDLLGRMA
jgi:hypothetical protein